MATIAIPTTGVQIAPIDYQRFGIFLQNTGAVQVFLKKDALSYNPDGSVNTSDYDWVFSPPSAPNQGGGTGIFIQSGAPYWAFTLTAAGQMSFFTTEIVNG